MAWQSRSWQHTIHVQRASVQHTFERVYKCLSLQRNVKHCTSHLECLAVSLKYYTLLSNTLLSWCMPHIARLQPRYCDGRHNKMPLFPSTNDQQWKPLLGIPAAREQPPGISLGHLRTTPGMMIPLPGMFRQSLHRPALLRLCHSLTALRQEARCKGLWHVLKAFPAQVHIKFPPTECSMRLRPLRPCSWSQRRHSWRQRGGRSL